MTMHWLRRGQVVTVGIVPQYIEDEQKTVETVAQITQINPEKIRASIASARPDWFVPIADVSFETSLQYDELFNEQLAPAQISRARTVRTYIRRYCCPYYWLMGSIPVDSQDQYVATGYTGE